MSKKTVTTTTTVTTVTTDAAVPHIVAVLDISGSMESIKTDAIGAYNSFIAEQQKMGDDAKLTVILFDDKYEVLQDGVAIRDAIKFDETNFKPRGMTAMNDAIGRTINHFKDLQTKGNLGAGAIFTIVTDGQENASKEFKASQIKDLITETQSKLDWKFVYLAANQDAFAVGHTYGFSAGNTLNFAATGVGVRSMAAGMSEYVSSYRTTKRDEAADMAAHLKSDPDSKTE